jgi:hypothetical protein
MGKFWDYPPLSPPSPNEEMDFGEKCGFFGQCKMLKFFFFGVTFEIN